MPGLVGASKLDPRSLPHPSTSTREHTSDARIHIDGLVSFPLMFIAILLGAKSARSHRCAAASLALYTLGKTIGRGSGKVCTFAYAKKWAEPPMLRPGT